MVEQAPAKLTQVPQVKMAKQAKQYDGDLDAQFEQSMQTLIAQPILLVLTHNGSIVANTLACHTHLCIIHDFA